MKRLLLLSYEWGLRLTFSLILILSALAFLLVLVDFSYVDENVRFLDHLKRRPQAIAEGVWIGGYFTDERFIRFLKKNKIRVVVSLLDVDMIHERKLYRKEKKILKKLGILLINTPVKPLISGRQRYFFVRKTIRKWRSKGFRIYIHSYLGRFRTERVKEALHGR